MAKAISLEEKYGGAKGFWLNTLVGSMAFIQGEYGDEGLNKYLTFFGKSFAEQWKQAAGEGAQKAVNFNRQLFQIVGNEMSVLEESADKATWQATKCGCEGIVPTGPESLLCKFCDAAVVETAKALGWKATAKVGTIPDEWSVTTT